MQYAVSGSQSEFVINNTKAGPGSLAVSIEGPSKVKMDCQEVPEGYKVLYTPMAPGTYHISIKYGGPNHISGSPFKAKVTGTSQRQHHLLVAQENNLPRLSAVFICAVVCRFEASHQVASF